MNILDAQTYLDPYFKEIEKAGIDLSRFPLDHLGFSTVSKEHYETTKVKLQTLGKLIREHLVSGRRVAVFRLKTPIIYNEYSIDAIELIEPKKGESPTDGFEHVEFTINLPFMEIVNRYPKLDWDTSSINRPDFPRLKLLLGDGKELKLNKTPILEED